MLTGVEPDEIDLVSGGSDETGSLTTSAEADSGENNDTDPSGDGDPGDGDGDPGPGDGDGDPTTGGDSEPCENLMPPPVGSGDNPITVVEDTSLLEASCGAGGPESIYTYTAGATGLVSFALIDADFDAALYLVGESCEPLEEIACAVAPDTIEHMMNVGDSVYVVVDSFAGGGSGTLQIN